MQDLKETQNQDTCDDREYKRNAEIFKNWITDKTILKEKRQFDNKKDLCKNTMLCINGCLYILLFCIGIANYANY